MKAKWYVYKFFSDDDCVYVGKGSGKRFYYQTQRFKMYRGQIVACFFEEEDALSYEKANIIELAPAFNKAMMPAKPSPWKYEQLPDERDFDSWCSALGTKAMAGRVLASFVDAYVVLRDSKAQAARKAFASFYSEEVRTTMEMLCLKREKLSPISLADSLNKGSAYACS